MSMGLLFAVLFLLFLGGFDFYQDAGFIYSYAGKPERIMLCLLAVIVAFLIYASIGKLMRICNDKVCKVIVVVASLCAVALQMYFLFYVRSYYKWDSGFVIGGASSLAETGKVAEQAHYYLSVYPNQNTFVCITAALVKLSDLLGISVVNRPLVFNIFNTFCMDAAVVLSVLLLKQFKPEKSKEIWMRDCLFILCNPFLYLGVSYYYTITLSLPLTMGFLLLIMNGKEKEQTFQKSVVRWVLAGVLLGIGYELRATAVILGIAAMIAGLKQVLRTKEIKKSLIKFAVIAGTTVLVATGLDAVQSRYVGLDTHDTAFPTTHWLMMSLTPPGSHNAEDEAYTASFATKEEKEAAVKERLAEKLDAMSASEYIALIKTKVQNTFGNGTNGYEVFLADALRTDGIYESVFGGHKNIVVLWHQGYYLFLMLGILLYTGKWIFGEIQREETAGWEQGFFLLMILLGAILFYVLWEASEQYSVPFMMIMTILGLLGLSAIPEEQKEKTAVGLGILAAVCMLIWGIVRVPQFTREVQPYSYKAAVQILANTSLAVDDDEILCQTLELKRPFNRLIIQWRNPDMEESTARYRVELRTRDMEANTEEIGGSIVVYTADINASGTGYNGAGIYDFSTVVPGNTSYEIVMYKTGGEPAHDLEFVVYDMPGYTPYAAGELTLTKGQQTERLQASLLFAVSEEKTEAYTSIKKYIFFVSVLFILFLFMGFWCKLRVVSFTKEEQ